MTLEHVRTRTHLPDPEPPPVLNAVTLPTAQENSFLRLPTKPIRVNLLKSSVFLL